MTFQFAELQLKGTLRQNSEWLAFRNPDSSDNISYYFQPKASALII